MGKSPRIEIQEIFMAKAGNDWTRCYHGTIRREEDDNGNPVCYGKIKIGDGYIYAMGKSQWELGERLDELVLMTLDMGLHDNDGVTTTVAGYRCLLN